MNNRLVIIGAGGHGKVIADIALKCGYTNICFVDDNSTGEIMDFQIIGNIDDVEELNEGHTDFIIGIGNNEIRKRIAERFDINWRTLIHPSAQIATHVSIGCGTVVMAGAVVNVGTTIGNHCVVNTCSSVDHDCIIGDFSHIAVGAHIAGTVHTGETVFVGAGAPLINNVDICNGSIIGAGAVVIKTIIEKGTYIGVPAKRVK